MLRLFFMQQVECKMWPFKPKKQKYKVIELLEKRLREKNILNDDEMLFLYVSDDPIDEYGDYPHIINICKENIE